jgi:1-acyl-sn-glycerol-3-phosphate acyltransferase
MIKARHHWFFKPFFDRYVAWLMNCNFHHIEVKGNWAADSEGCLIIGNHVSWWDGFWALYLNNRFLHKKLHVMMLEEQLRKNPILNTFGAFSIAPGSRLVLESLHYASEIVQNNEHVLVIYPQGEIRSQFASYVPFQKGIEWVMKKASLTKVYMYVALVDYFSNKKPTLTFYLLEKNFSEIALNELEGAYHRFHSECVFKQSQKP